MKKETMVTLRQMLWIVLLALTLGLAFNHISASGIPLDVTVAQPDSMARVTLVEMKQIVERGSRLILDARYPRFYKRAHIPGALSVPYNSKQLETLMKDVAKDRAIVTYCFSEQCPQGEILARRLKQMGFTDVAVFYEGFSVWKAAQQPVENKVEYHEKTAQ